MELTAEIPTWNGRPSGSSPPGSDRQHTQVSDSRTLLAPLLRQDIICRLSGAESPRTMTIDRRSDRHPRRLTALTFRALGIVFVCAVFATAVGHVTEDRFAAVERAGWLSDYARIKDLIAGFYPGLDWSISEGRLDLHRLDRHTQNLLEDSESAEESEQILRDFLGAFHDGHLRISRPGTDPVGSAPVQEPETLSATTSGEEACRVLGYKDRDARDGGLELAAERRFRTLGFVNPFAAGSIAIDRHIVGLIRIPSFQPAFYGRTCASEWERYRATLATTCEAACRDAFTWRMFSRLEDDLGRRIGQLRELGVHLLVVDVRHNPGGSGVLESGAEELFNGAVFPRTPIAVEPSVWMARMLDKQRALALRALALCPAASPARRRLESVYRELDAAAAEAAIPCDRRGVWLDWGARAPCATLVRLADPDSDALADGETDPVTRSRILLSLEHGTPARPHWRGPLVVLTDERTGSAAEWLAGRLQDYAGAVVVGERTHGSGGGWWFGSIYWTLEHSGLELLIPDHESYRRNGTSYQAGVTPDVYARFDSRDDDNERAHALVEGLRQALARIFAEHPRDHAIGAASTEHGRNL